MKPISLQMRGNLKLIENRSILLSNFRVGNAPNVINYMADGEASDWILGTLG